MMELNPRTRQVMTHKPISVPYFSNLDQAYQLMKSCRIRHLPVSNEEGNIIGILSERDLERAMQPREFGGVVSNDAYVFHPEQTVEDYMNSPIQTIEESSTIRDAARTILTEKVSALLVVTQDGAATGIVTTDDLIRYLMRMLDVEPKPTHPSLKALVEDCWLLDSGYRE